MDETLSVKELVTEGKKDYQSGDFLAAARAFDAAAQGYFTAGEDLTAAEMRNNSSVAYLKAGDAQAALQAVEGTPDIFSAAGDVRRQAIALGNLGAALEAVKKDEQAEKAYEESAELLKQIGDRDLRVYVMQSLSSLQMRAGRQLEALSTMQFGLEEVEHPTPKQSFIKKLLRVPLKLLNKS